MKKASETITHINNPEDVIYLKTKAFPVNMRLFHSSKSYRELINMCVKMVRDHALANYEDYKKPHGMSGANLAIPFNIIGIVEDRGKKTEKCWIMINPEITSHGKEYVTNLSNCGSIRMKNPIEVVRHKVITVKYFTENGEESKCTCIRYSGTIQHEIDHNNGILITDRAKSNKRGYKTCCPCTCICGKKDKCLHAEDACGCNF